MTALTRSFATTPDMHRSTHACSQAWIKAVPWGTVISFPSMVRVTSARRAADDENRARPYETHAGNKISFARSDFLASRTPVLITPCHVFSTYLDGSSPSTLQLTSTSRCPFIPLLIPISMPLESRPWRVARRDQMCRSTVDPEMNAGCLRRLRYRSLIGIHNERSHRRSTLNSLDGDLSTIHGNTRPAPALSKLSAEDAGVRVRPIETRALRRGDQNDTSRLTVLSRSTARSNCTCAARSPVDSRIISGRYG